MPDRDRDRDRQTDIQYIQSHTQTDRVREQEGEMEGERETDRLQTDCMTKLCVCLTHRDILCLAQSFSYPRLSLSPSLVFSPVVASSCGLNLTSQAATNLLPHPFLSMPTPASQTHACIHKLYRSAPGKSKSQSLV